MCHCPGFDAAVKGRNIPTLGRRLGPDKLGQGDEGMSENNLKDRASIHDLFTRYCCALDNGEVEAVVDCFAVDAILKEPGHRHQRPRRNPRLRRPICGATRSEPSLLLTLRWREMDSNHRSPGHL
jgi:hypothetical protein